MNSANIKSSFNKYGFCKEIMQALQLLEYEEPTKIQELVIPAILKGNDVVGKSQTGSGKTAAFGIPICDAVNWEEFYPQALILEPTRELAVQVQEEIFLIGRKKRVKIPVVFGGMPIDKQALSLKQKAHIVVGTPGRVLDFIRRETLILDKVRFLVIDEADLMLDMGFIDEVQTILNHFKEKPILLLFSATMGKELLELTERYMVNPDLIQVESLGEIPKLLEQFRYDVADDEKYQLFLDILKTENPENAMIFCGTREMVNTLYQKMKRNKIRCGMLHGGMEQRDRLYAASDFRKGCFPYLITTDVAARGIDFPFVTHVFNYDFPTNKENYVHRIGRTARNGMPGKAISFIREDEKHYVKAVESYLALEIPVAVRPDKEKVEMHTEKFLKKQRQKIQIKEGKSAAYKDSIMKITIGGGKKSKLRPGDVVGAVCSITGVMNDDIGIIDVRESITYLEIMNGKGSMVYEALQEKTIKGKKRKISKTR